MELSKNILDGISFTVSNDSIISDSQYVCLLKEIFDSASGKVCSKETHLETHERDQKLAHASLLSLLLEAAKHDVHPSTICSLLEECQVASQRISTFTKMYQENKEKIQLQLSLIGKNYDQIIDVDWRQDYIIKSSNCEKICEPSYIISLKTWNTQNNSQEDITFGCSLEELQDLVLKLKDASKCLERNSA